VISQTPLDDEIASLESRLLLLPPLAVAIHAASCSERLIAFYKAFCEKDRCGDFDAVRLALDRIWDFLLGNWASTDGLHTLLEEVSRLTPDVDRFDSIESSVAQDVCVCLDSAVRRCLHEEETLRPNAVEYALGTLRSIVCVMETGCLDLGDSTESLAFESKLLSHPLIASELRCQKEDSDDLRLTIDRPGKIVAHIRRRSIANQIDSTRVLQELL